MLEYDITFVELDPVPPRGGGGARLDEGAARGDIPPFVIYIYVYICRERER